MSPSARVAARRSAFLLEDPSMSCRFSVLCLSAFLAAAPALAQAATADDPIVARVDGVELHKSDVEAARESLPSEVKQMPLERIYPMLLNQLVGGMLLTEAAQKAKLADDPEVKKRLAALKESVMQQVYVDRVVDAATTDDKLHQRYEKEIKNQKPKEEVKARHILVPTEAEAKNIIAQLDKGADFSTLAKEKSTDPSKETGGELGYFSRDDGMVPEFVDAAFKLKKGEYTKAPVHTQFGWHVIQVEDRREAAPPSFEDSKPQLKEEAAREAVGSKLRELRGKAKIETFALDGSPLPAKQ
jgi:peptidyl-prolyl cis-trans isomerase C